MQINTEDHGDLLEMRIAGRLDNEWAEHLSDAIDEAVRQGSHSIVLDLSDVGYMSSAGIGALVRAYKQLQSIRGFFGVGIAPPQVAEVIKMTGLSKMLLCDMAEVRARAESGSFRSTMQPTFRVAAEGGMNFELYDVEPKAALTCEVIGDATRFPQGTYLEQHCRPLEFGADVFGLGLGAFGLKYAECQNRFGEFLAAGGSVAQQPAGAAKPDFQLEQGKLVPHLQMAYGLRCRGGMRQHQRFEPAEEGQRISLSALVKKSLELNDSRLAGLVYVAETTGLIGATLRRSPTSAAAGSRMSHPEIRNWLSFSPERTHGHTLTLIVGVASRGAPSAELAPLLRPMGSGFEIYGHFHAAVFSYRPFKKRKLEMADVVGTLFESEDLQTVMHLLNDDREITGGGESEFIRGACWMSPITTVTGGPQR
ncbi:MAG TPA: STAS domain-containing protein [Schlesneria sp.]|jgi:anti-anti-sigma factor